MEHVDPQDWRSMSACRSVDPELFTPLGRGNKLQIALAKEYCNGDGTPERPVCPVRDRCLRFAMDSRDAHSILGGLLPEERSQLNRRAA